MEYELPVCVLDTHFKNWKKIGVSIFAMIASKPGLAYSIKGKRYEKNCTAHVNSVKGRFCESLMTGWWALCVRGIDCLCVTVSRALRQCDAWKTYRMSLVIAHNKLSRSLSRCHRTGELGTHYTNKKNSGSQPLFNIVNRQREREMILVCLRLQTWIELQH